jgi:hypothetical protein
MYTPLLAAVSVAALIALAPLATPTIADAMDAGDLFEPLTCAMAHSGPCLLTHDNIDPSQLRPHVGRGKPVLAALD